MNINDINEQVVSVLGTDSAEAVGIVTNAFEVAILSAVMEGNTVELEHLGALSNDSGNIVFKPSAFLTAAAAAVEAGRCQK